MNSRCSLRLWWSHPAKVSHVCSPAEVLEIKLPNSITSMLQVDSHILKHGLYSLAYLYTCLVVIYPDAGLESVWISGLGQKGFCLLRVILISARLKYPNTAGAMMASAGSPEPLAMVSIISWRSMA